MKIGVNDQKVALVVGVPYGADRVEVRLYGKPVAKLTSQDEVLRGEGPLRIEPLRRDMISVDGSPTRPIPAVQVASSIF